MKINDIKRNFAKLNLFTAISGIILLLLTVLITGMLIFAFVSSFNDLMSFERSPLRVFNNFKWENYRDVVLFMQVKKTINGVQTYIKMPEMYFNAVIVSIGCAFLGTLVMCTTAYMCSKFRNFFSTIIVNIVIVTMIIPIIGNTPSVINVMDDLGFYNNVLGVCIQQATFLGVYFLLFYASFNSVPNDFGEAAQVDGASYFSIYVKIYFPLVKNMFLTMLLLKFIEYWNNYQLPLLLMPDKPTISYGLYYLTQYPENKFNGNTPLFLAAAVMVAFPTITLFVVFHDRLLGNLTMGGIKG